MRQRVIKLGLIITMFGAIALLFINPFQASDYEAWKEEVSTEEYERSLLTLQNSLDNPRNTYFDYLQTVQMNYNLPLVHGILQSEYAAETWGYTGNAVADVSGLKEVTYIVDVPVSGYYNITVDHIIEGNRLNNLTISVAIDESFEFSDAKTIDVPLYWKDASKDFGVDRYGDQTLPRQERIIEWRKLELFNNTYTTNEPLLFYLESGTRTITIANVSGGNLYLGDLTISAPKFIASYDQYLNNYSANAEEFSLFINATDYVEKNSSYVRLNSFNDPSVEPYDTIYKKLNVLDGNAWNNAGQEVVFEVNVEQDGLYDITLHYANYKTDFEVFRSIYVDGEIPYRELMSYGIPYTPTKWANHTLSDDSGNPYKIYLTKGTHRITIRAEQSDLAEYLRDIQLLVDHINQFALEIIKITGKDIDKNRTWELTRYIPETESYLNAYETIVKRIVVDLSDYSELKDLSSTLTYLKRSVIEFDKMLKKPDELPLYLSNLYSGTQSVTLMLGDTLDSLADQQLYLDGLYVSNVSDYKNANAGFLARTLSSIERLINSYTSDKFKVQNEDNTIDVWVNRPITYVDIMQKMADSMFTEDTGYKVKISVMPDANKLILANSANNQPDIALGLLSYMPYDLAIRGALQDLSEFDDFWNYANNFAPGAIVPYVLDDGVYAMPETLEFHALVYRKDVFNALTLTVPNTWDDVIGILPTLQRYDMNFYYPTSGGLSIKWFYQTTPLIFQNGGSLYTDDGMNTAINSENSYKGLKLLGDLYTTYSLPSQVPLFYNSFRYNKLPVGIIDFNTYIQLKNAAPELVGQWALAPYPGTLNEQTGEIERWFVGNGTGGVMFKKTNNKQGAWEFMKWWMSTQTQTEFAYTLQSTYGPEFLWLSGNLNAVENTPIDIVDKSVILDMVPWLRDVPRTPGQYMLERGLSDIWNTVTFDGVPVRVAIDRQVVIINREIRRKMIEFGYLDTEGNVIRPYIIRDVDWIQAQMDNARGDD